jgi:hypothetical protein
VKSLIGGSAMFRTQRSVAAFVITVGLSIAAPACASAGASGYQRDYRDFERRAYDNGYREGFERGQRDGRDRRDFRVERDRDSREADDGYRGYGDRDAYRRFFRDGYRVGYTEGYNRVARLDRGRIPPRQRKLGIATVTKGVVRMRATATAPTHDARSVTGKATTTTTTATAPERTTSATTVRPSSRGTNRDIGTDDRCALGEGDTPARPGRVVRPLRP